MQTMHRSQCAMNDSTDDSIIFRQLEEDVRLYADHDLSFRQDSIHTAVWNEKYSGARQRYLTDGGIDRDFFRNFRRNRIYVSDNPGFDWNDPSIDESYRQYERALCRLFVQILHKHGYLDLLAKYPSTTVGRPYLYRTSGDRELTFTHRWFKHVYSIGKVNELLRQALGPEPVTLDIGSAYGVFQYLFHQEYPGSHQILVDLPEHLLFARYFLASCFPRARIAGTRELAGLTVVTREFASQYDFILMPAHLYERMEPGSVDLLTSFACLGELTREYFDYYVRHPVFATARHWYTVNPVSPSRDSQHSGGTDICLLDYPVWDSERLYFGVSPVFVRSYGYRAAPFPPFFEYIGRRRAGQGG